MKTYEIKIDTIEKVRDFVSLMVTLPYEADIISDRYVIDAKSVLGILSLDVSKPLKLAVHSEDCAEFEEALRQFIV